MKTKTLEGRLSALAGRIFKILPAFALGVAVTSQNLIGAPVPSNPVLQIQTTNRTAILSWSATSFWLQAAEDISSPLAWYNSPWAAGGISPQFSAAVPMDADARFFRLVSSPFLPPPTGLRASAGDSVIYVTWESVSNAVSYNLYFATVSGVTPANYNSLPGGTRLPGLGQPQAILDNLTLGLRYYFVATAVDANGESASSNEGSDLFGPQGQVHGSFFTRVFDGTTTNQVFVPGVTVSLVTVGGGTTLAQTTTDGSGQFVSAPVPAGLYQLCWSAAGYVSGCNTQQVVVTNDVVLLDPQEIVPLPGAGTGLVFGHVTLRDGSVPVFGTDVFGSSLNTTVMLHNSSNHLIRTTAANAWGQFLFTGLPAGTNLVLTAGAEAASISTNINTAVTGLANLVLPNTPPVIHSVAAFLGGQVVNYAPTGATVQVQINVTDAENDALHFAWLPQAGADDLVSVDSSNISLTLPATTGLIRLLVQARDGHGGYAHSEFDLNVVDQLAFSGFVRDTNGPVIANAVIQVNSYSTLSDSNGFFSLLLPYSQGLFLFSIQATGYAPYFRTFTDSEVGDTYYLSPLPTLCTNWSGLGMAFEDASGTTLALQDNSLDSAPGVPYFGPICVSIQTYDPCGNTPPFPAGNLAVDSLGQTNYILPQATAFISITDPSGHPLLIEPGLPATLTLPPGAACTPVTNLPSFVPQWVWDASGGVWRVADNATNAMSGGTTVAFIGPVIQLGLLAVAAPQAKGTLELTLDRTLNFPILLRLSTQADLFEFNEPNQRYKGAIPLNAPVTLELLSPKEAPGDFFTDPNNANTLRKDKDKTVILKITRTFANSDSIVLGLSAHIPALTADRVSENKHFLTFNSGQTTIVGDKFAAVDAYYRAIGFPRENSANTFAGWLKKNGFLPPNGTYPSNFVEDAGALYFNATDLGFARSMHMKTKVSPLDGKTDIAYYVVNYHTLEDAVADLAGKQPKYKAPATVAMDYAAAVITNITSTATNAVTNRITKFYVFDVGSGAQRPLRPDADLDGGGGKIVPNLCVTCHGTAPIKFNFNPRLGFSIVPPNGDTKARFIPFDLESFTYAPGKDAAQQQGEFRKLNRGVYLNTPVTDAMKELIEGWYGGPLNNGNNANFTPGFVPTGWKANAAQKSLYTDTVRISCRGCHTLRTSLPFNTFAGLNRVAGRAENEVCSALKMPNAQRTFTIFWGSMSANVIKNGATPNQPALMKNQFGWGACPAPP